MMFASILGGLAIGSFTAALAFGVLGDAPTAAWMLTGAFVCSIIAVFNNGRN